VNTEWAGMPSPPIPRIGTGIPCATRVLLALVCAGAWMCSAHAAVSTASPGLDVIPRPASQLGLSYFELHARPGASVRAGAVELQNPTGKRLHVALSAVDGETLDTLGSGYAPPGSRQHNSTLWLTLGARQVTLAPGEGVKVPVSVLVPSNVRPGDYLSGISIEALDQRRQGLAKKGVSIASVERYAIGVEVLIPGARHPLIQFTGASLERQPAGLTFQLQARNPGNVILQGVHGRVQITREGHTVISRTIEPGTFVTGTSMSYPVTAMHQSASDGTHYRVSAWLRYGSEVARLDTTVTFGHREAVIQGNYTHSTPAAHAGTAWWEIAGVAAVLLYATFTTILLLRRKQTSREAIPR
jgi:hypothetical protein